MMTMASDLLEFESIREGLTEAKAEEILSRFGMTPDSYYRALCGSAKDEAARMAHPRTSERVLRAGPGPFKTREQALRDLGRVVAEVYAATAHLTPLEAAERAWHPGGPSVEDLASRIAADRAERPAQT